MAISLVTSATGTSGGTGANYTVSWTGAAPGDVVVLCYSGSTLGNTVSKPSGYTDISAAHEDGSNVEWIGVCYKVMGPSPDTSVTVPGTNSSNDALCAIAYVLRGVDPSVIDATATTGTTTDPPAITPATTGAWVLDFVAVSGADSTPGTNDGSNIQTINDSAGFFASTLVGSTYVGSAGVSTNPGSWASLTSGNTLSVTVAVTPAADTGATFAHWLQRPPGLLSPASLPQVRAPEKHPQIKVPVDLASNGVDNGDFEQDTAGWESNSVFGTRTAIPTWDQSRVRARTGQCSLLVTWPDSSGNGDGGTAWVDTLTSTSYPIGATIRASAWVYVPGGNPDVGLEVVFRGQGATTSVKDAWVEVSLTWVEASGGQLFPGVYAKMTSPGQVCHVDSVRVEMVAAAQPITSTKANHTGYLGEPAETDLARALSRRKTRSLGLVTESDLSRVGTRRRSRTLSQPAETDSPQMLHRSITYLIGLAW